MKVISVFVSTLDGKITKGNLPPGEWASDEDQEQFRQVLQEHELIVMGSGTFDPKFVTAQTGTLRVVLTHESEKYEQFAKPREIEFINASPEALINHMEKRGYKDMLLVAGPKVTTEFFKKQLIDELWLTIEPKLFGDGKQILTEAYEVELQLLEIKQLNDKGTLLARYRIIKKQK